MQLSFVGHQFEHSAAYADSCEACVQLDRLDDLVAEPPAVSEVHRPAGREPVLQAPALASVAAVLAFNPRAPPFI